MLGLALVSLWLAEVWRRTRRVEIGERRLDPAALAALRACHFGAALWTAARLGPPGHAAVDAVANAGTAVAVVASLVALARLPSEGGLLAPASSAGSLDAAAFAGLLWGIAVAVPATRALFPASDVVLDPLTIDYATTTAAIGSLLVLVAAAWRLRVQRRLEIGVADRVAGALALSLTAVFVAIPAAAADIGPPDRVLPVAALAGALACAWTATTREPATVSMTLRGVLAVMILGVPAALFVAIAARAFPLQAGPIALGGSAVAIVVGLIARDVARPLGPEQSRWLEAIERASRGALQPDPEAAIRAALGALQTATRDPNAKPELFRNDPEEVLSVDVAGYLHVAKAGAPEVLYALAEAEPERTLRAEVLRAVEVRRPDVRPLLAWFDARAAFSATIVIDEEGPIGFLLLPRGKRKKPLTLEEARALRLLADRISALLAMSSALARSRERELSATNRATHVDTERDRLERIIDLSSSRHRAFADLAARPVRIATYSPAARFAVDELERHGKTGAPLLLLVPPGVGAAAWAAVAHLASPGAGGPLVVIDAATSLEHDEARWQDRVASPLALADGGTLVILDAPSLPLAIQDHIARALGRQATEAAASVVPPMMLIATARDSIDVLVAEGRVSPRLVLRLGSEAIALPPLAARGEDLRVLVLDRLAGVGMRGRGEPLGIDATALALLLEHRWPGNDVELEDVLVRAAEIAAGPVLTPANLAAVGFRNQAEATPLPAPTTPPESRRRRSRPARSLR
jgi:transcriptional regulator with GAF, ATPase, and Fis domain